ncbi:MAG TPA: DUF222 domain-containing protein [Acidimicrobiales bacterium]|nr:DUF222 domain-containing protein [Acidimicrobiales bacterium]
MFGVVECLQMQPLDQAVGGLCALDVGSLDPHDAAELLVELRREQARLAGVAASLTAAVDRGRPWAEAGFRSTAAWLAASDNTAVADARREVRLARRLASMPRTRQALAAGDISEAHAHRLATLNAPDTAGAFGEAEAFLVGQARTMRWADFVKETEYWLRLAREESDPDPDKADRDHRHVQLHAGLRGTGLLSGELTPLCKATVGAELERLEQQLFERDWADARARVGEAATVADLTRTPAQRRHDALMEMAVRSATAPADGKRPQPLLSVHVGYERFARLCELADGTVVSPATVAGQLDEAVIERIVWDGPSRVLDLGRARSFTGAARRAVEVRDRHCTHEAGCDVPAHRCEVDHVWRWTDGGPTHPDNGRLRCPPHHRQRERPPPPTTRTHHRQRSPDQAIAHLELLRARIRDRIRHDPTWG